MNAYDTYLDILQSRYSCRAYLPKQVTNETITKIVNAARHVPSWCNAQPWQLTITRGEGTDKFRDMLSDVAAKGAPPQPDLEWPAKYSGVYGERRRRCGFQLYDAVGVERTDKPARAAQMLRNFSLFDAPHVAIVTSPADLGPYGALDCGSFVSAFCLAATSLGIASIPQAAVASYAPQVRAHFDLPDDRLILCAISFGYANGDAPANGFRTERAETADIIDWAE